MFCATVIPAITQSIIINLMIYRLVKCTWQKHTIERLNLHQQWIPSESLKTMHFSMQMKYKLITSMIFYSEGLHSKQGTHLSLISLVSHVMWDWSERGRESLWLPATQLFAAAQCHCHSPAILMCSFLSTSINVTLGRHTRKWKAESCPK